jgi:hypothetical protein
MLCIRPTLRHSQSPGYTACFASTLPATRRPDPYQDWIFTSKQTPALVIWSEGMIFQDTRRVRG